MAPSRLSLVLGALLLGFIPARARGDSGDFHLTASAGTQLPVDVGARITLEGPFRLQLSTALGVMPEAYVNLLNSSLVAFGAYNDTTGSLIQAALKNSLIWRTQLGWRPFSSWGFYFQLGYTLATLGGDLTGSEAIAAATGKTLPAGASGKLDVDARSSLHMLGLELGYRWILLDRIFIQLELGGFGTIAASTTLSLHNAQANPRLANAMQPLFQAGEQYLDSTYTSYAFGGYVGLQAGYQFF